MPGMTFRPDFTAATVFTTYSVLTGGKAYTSTTDPTLPMQKAARHRFARRAYRHRAVPAPFYTGARAA